VLTVLVGVGSFGQAASADLVFGNNSGPIPAHSWKQDFFVNSDEAFKYLGLALTPFDSRSGLKDPAWEFLDGNPHGFTGGPVIPGLFGTELSVATGNSTNELVWRSHFDGEASGQSFLLTLFAFDDELNADIATALWTRGGWDFGPHTPGITWEEFVASGGVAGIPHAPVPAAAALGLLGLGMVGVLRRRFA
jgi:MYXO-CTERM domain-containing protein